MNNITSKTYIELLLPMKHCEVNKSNEDLVLQKLFFTKNKPKQKIKLSVI